MRTLIYRLCPTVSNGNRTTEVYYDSETRDMATVYPPLAVCNPFHLGADVLLDTYCEGTTKVEVYSLDTSSGRPPRPPFRLQYTANAPSCGVSSCGLAITDVQSVENNGLYTITVLTTGYSGEIEYSLNGFETVQDSNIFTNLTPGDYVAVARPKR